MTPAERKKKFLRNYMNQNHQERIAMGHQMNDFIKSCSFGGLDCSAVDNGYYPSNIWCSTFYNEIYSCYALQDFFDPYNPFIWELLYLQLWQRHWIFQVCLTTRTWVWSHPCPQPWAGAVWNRKWGCRGEVRCGSCTYQSFSLSRVPLNLLSTAQSFSLSPESPCTHVTHFQWTTKFWMFNQIRQRT